MVKACVVPGCKSDATVPAHYFPKNVARSESWANCIQSPKLLSLTTYERHKCRVCHKHFEKSAYCCDTQRRRLKPAAVPTLDLPANLHGCRNLYQQPDNTFSIENATFNPELDVAVPGPSTAHSSVQTSCKTPVRRHIKHGKEHFTARGAHFLKMAKLLQKKLQIARAAKQNFKADLKNMKSISGSEFLQQYKKLSRTQRLLIEMQSQHMPQRPATMDHTEHFTLKRPAPMDRMEYITLGKNKTATMADRNSKLNNLKSATVQHMGNKDLIRVKERWYTVDEKVLALALYKKSRSCYKLLRALGNFPSLTTLKTMLRKIPIKSGISPIIITHLRRQASKMKHMEKFCILMWDEMALEAHLNYDASTGCITGFEDWGTRRTSRFADHALVFMLRGINSGWKMPIAFYFCDAQTKAAQLRSCINTVINAVNKTGLRIIGTVCDEASPNVAAVNQLISNTAQEYWKKGQEHRGTIEVQGSTVIPFYDPPHLIKSVRNNLLTKDLEVNVMPHKTEQEKEFVSWKTIELVYNIDIQADTMLRMIPKITEEHVIPGKIKKMRVKYATQILSRSVAAYVDVLSRTEAVINIKGNIQQISKEAGVSTSRTILFFNNLFDSVNGHTAVPEAPLRTVLTDTSAHNEFWPLAIKTLKQMRYVNGTTKLPAPGALCLKNWINTIYSFQNLWKTLKAEGFTCLKTRFINQDPLENFFGHIRSVRHQNTNPTCYGFKGAYKVMLINNLTSARSIGSNCEDTCDGNLLFTLKKFVSSTIDEPSSAVEQDPDSEVSREKNIARVFYHHGQLSAVVLKKVLAVNPFSACQLCKKCLTNANKQKTFVLIEKTLHESIQHSYFKFQLTNILTSLLLTKIDFALFIECEQHREHLMYKIVKASIEQYIHKWCTIVNRILCGKDTIKRPEAVFRQAFIKYNSKLKKPSRKLP